MQRILIALGLAAGAISASAQVISSPVTAMVSPAPVGSAQPHLVTGPNGRVFLSWLAPISIPAATVGQKPAGGHAFQFSELTGNRWSTPRTIVEGPRFFANWADFPMLYVTRTGLMAAHWLVRRGTGRTTYDVMLRTSSDAGRTWTDAVTPHKDGTETEHGFVSFFETPGKGHGLGMIWLDGREMVGSHGAGGGQMTLRSAMVSAKGLPGAEMVIDGRVCDCCQTAATTTDTGVVVAYRDRSDKEIRDIAVSRLENGKWTSGTPVHSDNWEINGCPVNGPAIDAQGKSVALAWFTAVNNQPKTQLAFSKDGGRTFGAPIRIDSGTTLGRVGLNLLTDGRALVSWIDNTGANAQFTVRDVSPEGKLGAPVVVSAISGERTSGFPQVVVSGRSVIAAWTHVERGAPTKLSVVTATLAR
jgi:hypothetical protein